MRAGIKQQVVTALFKSALNGFFAFGGAFQRQARAELFADVGQYPDIHFVNQCAITKVVIKGADLELIIVVARHRIRACADRLAGEMRH
ncbi:hypothetical protein D3C78_1691880 [compost metagenome]